MNSVNDRSRDIGEFIPAPDDGRIICRCEEVTQGEIRRAVHDGMFTLTEIRRYLRTGMGLCQGQTCARLVKSIVARELKISPAELEPATSRVPMRPIEMRIFANEQTEEAEAAEETKKPEETEEAEAAKEPGETGKTEGSEKEGGRHE